MAQEVQAVTRRSRLHGALRDMWKKRMAYVMITPYMLIFLTFTVVPVIVSMILSFTQYNVLQSPVFVGLRNYTNLFVNDEVFAIAVLMFLFMIAINQTVLKFLRKVGG